VSGARPAGEDAAAVLAWMRGNGPLLLELVGEEREEGADASPSGDPAVRAHLRFVAAALLATARPELEERLGAFVHALPGWLAENEALLDEHLATGAGAIALEEHLQFGVEPGLDPSLDAGLHRRLRLMGWMRLFLLGLELHLGPGADGLGQAALAWMGERQRELSRLVLTLDQEAKAAARRAIGTLDIETQDEIGQAATVQGHVRLMVEAATRVLAEAG
jgi:hypothetical protein